MTDDNALENWFHLKLFTYSNTFHATRYFYVPFTHCRARCYSHLTRLQYAGDICSVQFKHDCAILRLRNVELGHIPTKPQICSRGEIKVLAFSFDIWCYSGLENGKNQSTINERAFLLKCTMRKYSKIKETLIKLKYVANSILVFTLKITVQFFFLI